MIEASQKLGTALGGRSVVMVTTRAERRLAAIMAADVVGYSRLMETDEAATLAALKTLRAAS
jgi:class 3 adenylate cyclase